MHKYALVVIDMQRGFLDPSSPLYLSLIHISEPTRPY